MTVDIASKRLRNQHLLETPLGTAEEAVQWLGAVQAQDYTGAKWALGQRVEPTTSAHFDTLFSEGKILRTHVMRPTWHFVHPTDIRWLLELTGPRVHAANAYYYRKFGLSDALLKKSEAVIAGALRGNNQLTRTEVAQLLKASDITASGLQLGYILMSAELNAVICSGALSGKQHTYALLDERVPKTKQLSREEALVELAKRYFTSHGPAQVQDFAWWSGLAITEAKAGIASAKLEQFDQEGKTYWSAKTSPKEAGTTVHLLPNYDEYLIAYKDRSAYITRFTVNPPVGIFDRHILVVNGKVVGAWRETLKGKTMTITVTPLVTLHPAEKRALDGAVKRYGQFIEKPFELLAS